ncbi:hypothetical protein BJ508DRAFT_334005 [Ascobolus immersus RN42]|uniref:C2H2-type domain-containing protein n=1 Tax=Ascobolus immersus RN42 TaxID=1160509 RepID=A0A3N4HJP6_ASCIM|nr:hypothetical protein BJ508DRAFT_334005 [Ascobolus immersus RN42]
MTSNIMNISALLLPVESARLPEDLSDMLQRPYIYEKAGMLEERSRKEGNSTSPESSPNSTSPPTSSDQIKQESPPARDSQHSPLSFQSSQYSQHSPPQQHHHYQPSSQQQSSQHTEQRIPPISIDAPNQNEGNRRSEPREEQTLRYGSVASGPTREGSLLPPVKTEPYTQQFGGYERGNTVPHQQQQHQQSHHHQTQQPQHHGYSQQQHHLQHQHQSQNQQPLHQQTSQQQQSDKITLPSLSSLAHIPHPPSAYIEQQQQQHQQQQQQEYKVPAYPTPSGVHHPISRRSSVIIQHQSQFLTQEQTPAQSPADTTTTSVHVPSTLPLRHYPPYTASPTASTPINIPSLLHPLSPAPTTPSDLPTPTPSRSSTTPTPPTLQLPPHHHRSTSRTPPLHPHPPRSPRHNPLNPMTRPLRPAPSSTPHSSGSASPQPSSGPSTTSGVRKSKESEPCRFCDKKFSNDFGLRRHLKTKHRDKLYPEQAATAGKGQEIYPCGYPVGGAEGGGVCTYSSPRKDHVLQHRRMRHHVVGRGAGGSLG